MTLSTAARASLDVQRLSTLDMVDAGSWNELSGAASIYLSHAWLRHVERTSGAECAYLVVLDAEGTLLGALPTYTAAESNSNYRTDLILDGRLSGRHLLAGSCRGYDNDLLVHPSLTDDEQDLVLGMLIDAAERRAADLGCDDVLFLYLSTEAAARLRRVRAESCPLLLNLDTVLPVQGESIDDYLAALGGRRAYAVRKDMRVFDAAGYTTAIEPLSECWHEAGPLAANVQNRHGKHETVEEARTSLRSQADALDSAGLAFTARREGKLVALAVHYAWRDKLYGRFVGFDYEALTDAREYFTLYYYLPLRWAYRNGATTLHWGMGSYSAKFRRGARPNPLWAASLTTSRAGDWRRWNTELAATWRDEWGLDEVGVPADWSHGQGS
jgi:uncharacterized protein